MTPYYSDASVTLYCGDMREILPTLDPLDQFDGCVTDPPYGETSLPWDRWPTRWPTLVAEYTRSMWCFGSLRMFLDRHNEFSLWRLSQDIVWEKHSGSGAATDRFRRVHELAVHWYRGLWREVYHEVPRVPNDSTRRIGSTSSRPRADDIPHQGSYGPNTWVDDGLRLTRSVIRASRAGRSIHPTEKPAAILAPLIEYSVPVGGLVLDPFAGSCSTLLTARSLGRRAIGIDADESMCETAAERLSIPDLFGGAA